MVDFARLGGAPFNALANFLLESAAEERRSVQREAEFQRRSSQRMAEIELQNRLLSEREQNLLVLREDIRKRQRNQPVSSVVQAEAERRGLISPIHGSVLGSFNVPTIGRVDPFFPQLTVGEFEDVKGLPKGEKPLSRLRAEAEAKRPTIGRLRAEAEAQRPTVKRLRQEAEAKRQPPFTAKQSQLIADADDVIGIIEGEFSADPLTPPDLNTIQILKNRALESIGQVDDRDTQLKLLDRLRAALSGQAELTRAEQLSAAQTRGRVSEEKPPALTPVSKANAIRTTINNVINQTTRQFQGFLGQVNFEGLGATEIEKLNDTIHSNVSTQLKLQGIDVSVDELRKKFPDPLSLFSKSAAKDLTPRDKGVAIQAPNGQRIRLGQIVTDVQGLKSLTPQSRQQLLGIKRALELSVQSGKLKQSVADPVIQLIDIQLLRLPASGTP